MKSTTFMDFLEEIAFRLLAGVVLIVAVVGCLLMFACFLAFLASE